MLMLEPDHEFPSEVAKFAENFESEEGGTIRSLEDVIHWNKEHARQALPERGCAPFFA